MTKTITPGQWIVTETHYGFGKEKISRVSKLLVYYKKTYGDREGRFRIEDILASFDEEKEAIALINKLTSAMAERDRRNREASVWFSKKRAEILGDL